ncbi:hypothetical protein FBEOM_7725 [Fusarium beomiforme]|uniref:CHK kinase-like domain-containing protein n=1 Tax=Fusarium beomiforme TaxID=44412 RepID=A0A9P5AGN5_9HYPO|nr:hypothetical protein FBEOM_7725 [Fusarium beomiforme]
MRSPAILYHKANQDEVAQRSSPGKRDEKDIEFPFLNDHDKPLPLTPEEITAEWLSEALGVAVKDFKVSSVIHGTSSKVFVDLTFGEDVKTEIPSGVVVRGASTREAEFYYHVAPQTSMLLPKIWFTGADTVNGQGIFIMSDVSSEAMFGTPLEPWTPERVGEALKQLASLHAKKWNTKEEEYPWLFGKDGSKLENPVRPPVAKALLDPDRIRRGFQALWKHADADQKYYSLIHGDDHVGNTLIANDGTPGFIDWQGLQYGPSVLELAYFLTGALTVEDRRKSEQSLIETYLEALHKEGGPKLTREDLWDDYRRYSLQGFLWAMTPQTMQPDEVVFAMAERYSASIIDHGTLELLGV